MAPKFDANENSGAQEESGTVSPGDALNIITPCTKHKYERVACACPRQWLYLLGDEGVVYSETRRRVAGLDAAGVSAYRAFDSGAGIEDLRLAGKGHGPDAASGAALNAIHTLTQGIFPDDESEDGSRADWPDHDSSISVQSESANIEIHGIPISVVYPPGPWEENCRDCFRNCAASDKAARWRLSARLAGNVWGIYINDRKVSTVQYEQQLGLGLMHAARSLLYAEGKYDVAFHAAMVASVHCGVMFCAPREYGKSTLAAYLVTQGFDLVADEPALLDLDTSFIASLRMPICLKEGSWRNLLQHWPQLANAPVHIRSDGTRIRMAHLSNQKCSPRSRPLTHIVFPCYALSSSAEVELLSPLRALGLLTEGGMLLAKQFALEDFEAFLELLRRTPAYRLQYASLGEAHRMLYEIGC